MTDYYNIILDIFWVYFVEERLWNVANLPLTHISWLLLEPASSRNELAYCKTCLLITSMGSGASPDPCERCTHTCKDILAVASCWVDNGQWENFICHPTLVGVPRVGWANPPKMRNSFSVIHLVAFNGVVLINQNQHFFHMNSKDEWGFWRWWAVTDVCHS